ncbi:MAG: glycoside hydrolase family 97 protein [Candidatus Aminicenantes bacterium]|nr:glycoside hydrolase family 97 protein [Candidatus Aminicenantes bacterium]
MSKKRHRNFVSMVSALVLFLGFSLLKAENYELFSPDKSIRVDISVAEKISYSVSLNGERLVLPSSLSMTIKGKGALGPNAHVKNVKRDSVKNMHHPVVPVKSINVVDRFNEISFSFEQPFKVIFRAYNQGVAYQFQTTFKEMIQLEDEEVFLRFNKNHKIYFPTEESFLTHSERLYEYLSLSDIPDGKMASLPLLVDIAEGPKIAFTEAWLEDYPGLYLEGRSEPCLKGLFPAVAVKEKQTRDRTVEVIERADHIAYTQGTRSYPWRVLVIARKDSELIENQIVYTLSPPCRLKDTYWIKPGKVAWDWWNANNLFGVDFRAGINTSSYKYTIDFAASYGIEYIILDEGWSDPADLFKVNPDLDLEEILRYGSEKNVGIILWVVWKTLDDQLEPALNRFEDWGVKGIKVDFMQRDDQAMVNYYWKIAAQAAKRHLIVDFHGSYKPAGLRRAYPNVLTREGVRGLENVKWSKTPDPEHDLMIPFIRMLAGPMDYTPGAMINAQKKNFHPVYTRPMSMGTRCHQLAMYVVYESPLQMLADSASHYLREKECLTFLGPVPTVWEKTLILEASVGDYVLVARKSKEVWYVGAMTDWDARTISLDLSFLDAGEYSALIFQDGVNADRYGNDYKKCQKTVTSSDRLTLNLAPGGGWAAKISKK